MTTPYSLGSRRFVHIEDGEDQTASVEPTTCISFLQYNVLADAAIPKGDSGANINGSLSYCPESHRYMQNSDSGRHKRILAEVDSLDADIVTLQEIEYDYYHKDLQAAMDSLGYAGVHHLRKNDHLGLAIFYKQIKFSLVCQDSFIIHERIRELMNRVGIDDKVAKALQDHMREKATYPDLLDPPGCLFSKLRLRENYHTTICIGTTHITWKDFKYPVLQMLQGACVIEELMKFAGSSPCVLAGDFNTQPDMPLYQMILSGCVCEDTMNLLTSDEGRYIDLKLMVDKQLVVHSLEGMKLKSADLKSAYLTVMGKEPDATCAVFDESMVVGFEAGHYSGCLDYIWYSQGQLKPVTILDIPSNEELCRHKALPSVVFPSDHVPLYAKFKFCL